MQKDFDAWNTQKKRIDAKADNRYYKEREVWWCDLGVNVGVETDGRGESFRRPVVVLKGLSRESCFVVPLTRSQRHHKYRLSIGIVANEEAHALISQLRVIDTKRLVDRIGRLNSQRFSTLRVAVRSLF